MAWPNCIIIFLFLGWFLPAISAFSCRIPILHNAEVDAAGAAGAKFGTSLTIRCKAGFAASKPEPLTITCLSNYTWTPAPCELQRCPPIGLRHGHLVITILENYTRQAEASCNKGYVISGPTTRLCLGGGQWSGEKTKCKPVLCKDEPPHPGPPHSYNGVFNFTTTHGTHSDGYPHGTMVVVSCKERYVFTGSRLWVCGMSGRWVGTKGECRLPEDIKCKPPALEPLHGTFNLSDTDVVARYGQRVRVLCNPGYILEGAGISTCQANGTWTPHGQCLPTATTATTTTNNNDNNNNNNNNSTGSATTTHRRQQEQHMNTRLSPDRSTGSFRDHNNQRRVRRGRRWGHMRGQQYKLRHPVHYGDPSYSDSR